MQYFHARRRFLKTFSNIWYLFFNYIVILYRLWIQDINFCKRIWFWKLKKYVVINRTISGKFTKRRPSLPFTSNSKFAKVLWSNSIVDKKKQGFFHKCININTRKEFVVYFNRWFILVFACTRSLFISSKANAYPILFRIITPTHRVVSQH